MKYVKSLSQLAKQIPNVETGAVGISERNCQRWVKRFGWKKTKHGYDVASCIRDVEQALENHPSHGANGDLKDELLKEKIALLRIRRQQAEGTLVLLSDVMDEQRRLVAGYRGAIETWKQYTIARHPHLANAVDDMADDLLRRMRESIPTEKI